MQSTMNVWTHFLILIYFYLMIQDDVKIYSLEFKQANLHGISV
jgi:hypothetical protein